MRAVLKKLRKSRAGFSLAETLIAILILLMVSAIAGGAIPAASQVYTKTVDVANAQILISTAMNMLRNELGTAQEVYLNGNTIIYKYVYTYKVKNTETGDYNIDNYRWGKIEFGTYALPVKSNGEGGDGGTPAGTPAEPEQITGIWLYDGSWNSATGQPAFSDASRRLLVSKEAITKNLELTCGTVSFDQDTGVISFNNLQVKRENVVVDSRTTFEVKTLVKHRPESGS